MALLLDIDGTLLDAGRPIDGAADAVQRLRERRVPFLFATNTSRKSRADVAASLREVGIAATDDEVLSASFAAAELLRRRGIRRVRLLLPRSACADYSDFVTDADDPEAVVVGDMGPEVTFGALNEAFRAVRGGARLVATQKNRYWNAADGPTLDAGAFVAALEYAARVDAEIVGKPAPGFFRAAAEMLGVEASSLTIVGDDLESDVAGGKLAGLGTILVRTGKFDASRWAELPAEKRPDRVLDSIADVPDAIA